MPTLNRDQLDPAFDDAAAGVDPVTAAKLAEEAANIAQAAEAAARAEARARAEAVAREEASGAAASTDGATTERRPVDTDTPSTPPTAAASDEYYAAKEAEEAANIAAAAGTTDGDGDDASASGAALPDRPFDAPPGWANATERAPAGLPEQARVPLDAGAANGGAEATNGAVHAPDGPDVEEDRDADDPAWGAAGSERGDLASAGPFDDDAQDEGRSHGHGQGADPVHGHDASSGNDDNQGDDPGE